MQVARARAAMERVDPGYGDSDAERRLQGDIGHVYLRPRGGLFRYLTARTRFFDAQLATALDGGITQVVVAGAGYDGRAWRFAKPGVRFFELDHPDTQRDKRARVERLGLTREHIRFVAADFAADGLADALAAAGHDASVATVFICEGVLPYLGDNVTRRVLRALAGRATPDSRLLAEFSVRRSGAQAAARAALGAAVAALGEPLAAQMEPEAVRPLLAECGWRRASTPIERLPGLVVAFTQPA